MIGGPWTQSIFSWTRSMDPVHGGGPWTRSPCFVLSLLKGSVVNCWLILDGHLDWYSFDTQSTSQSNPIDSLLIVIWVSSCIDWHSVACLQKLVYSHLTVSWNVDQVLNVLMTQKISHSKNTLIGKAFQSGVKWRFSFCDIFFCSRDIQVFLLCKFSHWSCHQLCSYSGVTQN